MRDADVEAVEALATLTFEDLDRRRGVPPPPRSRVTGGQVRMRRVLDHRPRGLLGRRRAGRRAGRRGAGDRPRGRLGPARCSSCGPGCSRPGSAARCCGARSTTARGRAAGSSSPRRTRARCASTAAPASRSTRSCPRRARRAAMAEAPGVRAFTAADHAMAAAVDRRARGAAHGGDLDAIAEAGGELLALPGRGYAGHRDGKLIAARRRRRGRGRRAAAHGARPHAGRDRGRHRAG